MNKGIIFDIKKYAIHDGPGIRTTVFFKGCPMHCPWCHNPESILKEPEVIYREDRCKHCDDCVKICPQEAIVITDDSRFIDKNRCDLCGECEEVCNTGAIELSGREMTVAEVIKEIETDLIFFDESGGGVTFSGGEPLYQPKFLRELLVECKKRDIQTTLDTSGYCSWQKLQSIQDLVDLFLFDLKLMNARAHQEITGVSNDLILNNLTKLSNQGKNIIVRIPVISGINDHKENIYEAARFLHLLPNIHKIDLLPYHKMGVSKFQRLSQPEFIIKSFQESDGKVDQIKDIFEHFGFQVKVGG